MRGLIVKGGPVMYLLIACSILALAVVLERIVFWISFGRRRGEGGIDEREMTRFLPILDTLVTLSPLLGILGTVSGIIQSFGLLGDGVKTMEKISGGIGQALITTAAGLVVAMVSLVFYNYFAHRYQVVADEKGEINADKESSS